MTFGSASRTKREKEGGEKKERYRPKKKIKKIKGRENEKKKGAP